ncbi:MAG: trypsin-like peptidase domain-containing protein [Candidatus Eremiobacteraeota bacterium]|nr:trypsin-like peptidase domain-containing protein [Candidatus Eremiobacteraeota bacterium]MBV8338676.1 trypsin-like peptidase domain-containing protein [Candidatus Eremiobacteraeota bacterium]MBV8461444.1 trypsin-like peptidase domain-containing protein [Candidatus Eremiobacteraeota bacterium]MBV8668284.1 trypsin-like peptidase domain-containing protein [Candidatus Eremiobacteraeota bacterium]MBV8671154.1 trypsin-like peptidase domain-containing protein [Candidatus Eremiobacteraeota bacterium
MSPQIRTSLGFLLMGLLGVLIGAFLIAFAVPRFMHTQPMAAGFDSASAAPLEQIGGGDFEQRVISVVKQAEPSVVLIKATVHGVQNIYNPFQNDPFFRQFFGDQGPPESQPFTAKASGSGFIIKRDHDTAFVATNAHVIWHADHVQVLLASGRQVDAEVVGADNTTDLAILKIHGSNLPPALPLGNSSGLQQGQFVLAIGEPESFQNSVSLGIVSALHRTGIDAGGGEGFPVFHYDDMIQITTPINPGNSGGPLITTAGKVVGINAVVAMQAQAIGFAIPINAAEPVLAEIETTGHGIHIAHAYIGVQMRALDKQLANYLGYNGSGGVVVVSVQPQSPAEKSGLQSRDIILELNHQKVTDPDQIRTAIAKMKVGEKITLLVWRDGNLQPTDVTLGDRPDVMPQG